MPADGGPPGFTGAVADPIVAVGELGVVLLVFTQMVIPSLPSGLVLSQAGWQAPVGRRLRRARRPDAIAVELAGPGRLGHPVP